MSWSKEPEWGDTGYRNHRHTYSKPAAGKPRLSGMTGHLVLTQEPRVLITYI